MTNLQKTMAVWRGLTLPSSKMNPTSILWKRTLRFRVWGSGFRVRKPNVAHLRQLHGNAGSVGPNLAGAGFWHLGEVLRVRGYPKP